MSQTDFEARTQQMINQFLEDTGRLPRSSPISDSGMRKIIMSPIYQKLLGQNMTKARAESQADPRNSVMFLIMRDRLIFPGGVVCKDLLLQHAARVEAEVGFIQKTKFISFTTTKSTKQ